MFGQNSSDDTILPLAQLAAELPRRKAGRPTAASTLYGWTNQGCRGVRLEYVQIGATRCSTRAALSRFFARLTEDSLVGSGCSQGGDL